MAVWECVHGVGGTVEVDSERGVGTQFRFTFAAARVEHGRSVAWGGVDAPHQPTPA